MAYRLKGISKLVQRNLGFLRNYSESRHPFVYSKEVSRAKSENMPIVALESTIITHGMPYPQNLETALEVENIIRQRGAVPATVAILKGQLTVGLTEDQLRYLAQAKGVIKASRRDLAYIAAAKLDGATTVAGTIIASELADIPVFVTGGIGGVHREGESTLDISADLNELGRSKTLVVCSGIKSILDIGRTLEYLETQGVCVCSFGESNEFPAFYTVRSGHRAPYNVADAKHAARILHESHRFHLNSGVVIAVPVPRRDAMDEKVIEEAINSALTDAKRKGIRGKEVTPYILSNVSEATSGTSLETNIALIKNNARVGADIAVEFKKLKNADNVNDSNIGFRKGAENISNFTRTFHTSSNTRSGAENCGDDTPMLALDMKADGDVLVIGGANVDRTYRVSEDTIQLDGSTHACVMDQCGGGVGRNMAEALWRLRGGRTKLLTAIGDDADGKYLEEIAPGLILNGCVVKNGRTPTYAAVMDSRGECLLGLGDMALHNDITVDRVNNNMTVLEKAPLVVLDGNVPQITMDHVLEQCQRLRKPVFFEPTDRRKATKILQNNENTVAFSSPNVAELKAMATFLEPNLRGPLTSDLEEIKLLSKIVAKRVQYLIVTAGSKGVFIVNKNITKEPLISHFPVDYIQNVENVSGAGDCFSSGFVLGVLLGLRKSLCIRIAFETAKAALLCKKTVPQNLNVRLVYPKSIK
ncbi:pseudouridine-metabolizing bifunctional protein C1861.05 isoform X2 [Bombyx mandarina]|nr:pseudouridine-metabolizing bifunctional protein C1861.05 isoform X2 [Bombyx mandarina]